MSTAKQRIMLGVVVLAGVSLLTWQYVVRRPLTPSRLAALELEAIVSGRLSPLYEHLTERDKKLLGSKQTLERVEGLLGDSVSGWRLVGVQSQSYDVNHAYNTTPGHDSGPTQGIVEFSQTIKKDGAARLLEARIYEVGTAPRISLITAVSSWMMYRYAPVGSGTGSHISLLICIEKYGTELSKMGLPGLYRNPDPAAEVSPWSKFADYAWTVLRREGMTDEEVLAELKQAGIENAVMPPIP